MSTQEQNTPRITFFSENELKDAIKETASKAYEQAFNDGIEAVQKLLRECNPVSLSPLELVNVLQLLKMGNKKSDSKHP